MLSWLGRRSVSLAARVFSTVDQSHHPPRDLLISVASRTTLEIVQPISRKDQMRVRIDKSREDDSPTRIDNVRIARLLLDLIAGSNEIDPAVANKHSSISE